MSVEANKANVRRLIETVFLEGNMSVVDELIAPNYILHYPGMDYKGPEGLKQYFTMMRDAFPDMHVKIDNIIAEGDMVALFATHGGTFKGELMGIAPTGKSFSMSSAVLSHHGEDSKQVEAWAYADQLTMYQLLGVKPPMG